LGAFFTGAETDKERGMVKKFEKKNVSKKFKKICKKFFF
jgi:hypothetical protein